MSGAPIPHITGGYIQAADVPGILASTGMTIDELMLALIPQAQKFALPAISNFLVGAVAIECWLPPVGSQMFACPRPVLLRAIPASRPALDVNSGRRQGLRSAATNL